MSLTDKTIKFFNVLGTGLVTIIHLLSGGDKNYAKANQLLKQLNSSLNKFNSEPDSAALTDHERAAQIIKLAPLIKELEKAIKNIQSCPDKVQMLIRLKSLKAQLKDSNAADIKPEDIKTIIFTSAGGAGHEVACLDAIDRAKIQGISEREILLINMTTDGIMRTGDTFVGRILGLIMSLGLYFMGIQGPENTDKQKGHIIDYGAWGVDNWNTLQKIGDANALKQLVKEQPKSEIFFGDSFDKHISSIIKACPNLLSVESNQPLGNHRIANYVKQVNKSRSSKNHHPIKIVFSVTDYLHPGIPGRDNVGSLHFNLAFRKISSWENIELRVPDLMVFDSNSNPIINPSYEQKIQQLCRLYPSLKQAIEDKTCDIVFTQGPVREPFKAHNLLKTKNDTIKVQIKSASEDGMIARAEQVSLQADLKLILGDAVSLDCSGDSSGLYHEIKVSQESKVHSIMLGSQASEDGTMSLVNARAKAYKAAKDTSENIIFVFCGKNKDLYKSVLKKSYDFLNETNGQLKIVPLGFQDADMVSHVFGISESITFRPGGGMCMELESTLKKQAQQQMPIAKLYAYAELPKEDSVQTDKLALKEKYLQMQKEDKMDLLMSWERTNTETVEINLKSKGINVSVLPTSTITAEDDILSQEYRKTKNLSALFTHYLNNPTAKNRHRLRNHINKKDLVVLFNELRTSLVLTEQQLFDGDRLNELMNRLLISPELASDKADLVRLTFAHVVKSQRQDLKFRRMVNNDDRKALCLIKLIENAYSEFLLQNKSSILGLNLYSMDSVRVNTKAEVSELKKAVRSALTYEQAIDSVMSFMANEKRGFSHKSISFYLAKSIISNLGDEKVKDFVKNAKYSNNACRKEIFKVTGLQVRAAVDAMALLR